MRSATAVAMAMAEWAGEMYERADEAGRFGWQVDEDLFADEALLADARATMAFGWHRAWATADLPEIDVALTEEARRKHAFLVYEDRLMTAFEEHNPF